MSGIMQAWLGGLVGMIVFLVSPILAGVWVKKYREARGPNITQNTHEVNMRQRK